MLVEVFFNRVIELSQLVNQRPLIFYFKINFIFSILQWRLILSSVYTVPLTNLVVSMCITQWKKLNSVDWDENDQEAEICNPGSYGAKCGMSAGTLFIYSEYIHPSGFQKPFLVHTGFTLNLLLYEKDYIRPMLLNETLFGIRHMHQQTWQHDRVKSRLTRSC